MRFHRILNLRQQSCPFLADLSADYMEAFCTVTAAHGRDAARCWCLGA